MQRGIPDRWLFSCRTVWWSLERVHAVGCGRHKSLVSLAGLAASVLAAGLPGVVSVRATEAPQTITLELDRATLVILPQGKRRIVVVGDPLIARVTPLSDGWHAVLTGMAYGETRVSVLDATGAVVMESLIRVKEPADIGVTVHRGPERTSYFDCARRCQRRLQLGDNVKDFADIGEQIRAREGQAEAPRMEGGSGL